MPYGIEHKDTKDLKQILECYRRKIPRIKSAIEEEREHELLLFLKAKLRRLEDKKSAVLDELEKRRSHGNPESWRLHRTVYYIDYVNGNDANDGLSPATAWKTIPRYTTNTVRSPGDIAYVRRGQTHLYNTADVVFDEDGGANNLIKLMGDDGTGWPDETGLDKPIIDLGGTTYRVFLSGDYYWHIEDFDFTGGGNSTYGAISFYLSAGCKLLNSIIRDNTVGKRGSYLYSVCGMLVKDCKFYSNVKESLRIHHGPLRIEDCEFDGGAQTTDYGLYNRDDTIIWLKNSKFGVSSFHDIADIGSYYGLKLFARNVILNSPGKLWWVGQDHQESYLKFEDYQGEKGNNWARYPSGDIYKDTTILRVGGGDSSERCEPSNFCGVERPLKLFEYPLWLKAQQYTLKVYMRGSGWTTLPTADELWIEVDYWDSASSKRATAKSTQTLPANDVWQAFSVTITPYNEGPVYLKGYLAKYESGAKVYVDVKPIIS